MPDINSQSTDWVNVYSATGIAAGTPIAIQNKSNLYILVQESASQPESSNNEGLILHFSEEVYLDGASAAWIRGSLSALRAYVWEQ